VFDEPDAFIEPAGREGILGNILGSFMPDDFLAAMTEERAENDLLPTSLSLEVGLGLGRPDAEP
jgi:hypothetical protein